MHAKIDPKNQKISKIQVLRMILHEAVQKNIQRLHQFYFDQINSKKNWMDIEMKVRTIKKRKDRNKIN